MQLSKSTIEIIIIEWLIDTKRVAICGENAGDDFLQCDDHIQMSHFILTVYFYS